MNAALWVGEDAIRATRAMVRGVAPAQFPGVSIDSRTVKPGELYVAIKGDVHDGHDFVAAALANGAGAALVSAARANSLAAAEPLLVVADALNGLEALGQAARKRTDARIVAVTGSAGKTGTKEALALALGKQGATHFAVASFNNHWGVPLTLARMPANVRFGVFEIGMNHAGEITPLTAMVRPHVAIVTTIAPVHLAFFSSLDQIADAKGEIFSGLQPGGVAIVNGDIEQAERLVAHAKPFAADIVLFGESQRCAARLIRLSLHADGSDVEAEIHGLRVHYELRNPGRHVAMNSLAVLAAAKAVGADVAAAAQALHEAPPPAGRGAREVLAIGGATFMLIDESYNANPVSMRAALDNLGRIAPGPGGRRIAVMGDMLELGSAGEGFHRGLLEGVEVNRIDLVYACGPLMKELWNALPESRRGAYAPCANELQPSVLAAIAAGDVVTVKGSLGSRMGPIVRAMRVQFAPPASG